MRCQILPLAAAIVALLAGCTSHLTPPGGYVPLRDPRPYEFRAVSANGCAIATTTQPNEDKSADLKFWAAAIERQKVTLDKFKLIGREPIRSNGGTDGTLLRFEVGEGQSKTAYVIAVFVTPQTIRLVEAAGAAAEIDKDLEPIRTAIKTVR